MTNKRKEQFEADRQKMLAAIGSEPEEPIEVEDELPELKEFRATMDRLAGEDKEPESDFQAQLSEIREDSDSADEFFARAKVAFDDDMDFEDSLKGKSEEEVEKAKRDRRNKRERTKQRKEQKGSVNGFGVIVELLDNFYATFGGGVLFMFALMFVLAPFTAFWWGVGSKGTWLLGLIVGGFGFLVVKLACMWLSFLAGGIVKIATSIGPRFICEIREGKPGSKLAVTFANCLWTILSWQWVVSAVVMAVICVITLKWQGEQWIYSYFATLFFSVFSGGLSWFFFNLIGYAFYVGFIRTVLSRGNCHYRLRYLHDRGRIMAEGKGKLIDKNDRLKAFSQAYLGHVA